MWKNRQEAGQMLSLKLSKFKNKNAVIYALPRGGVVLGGEINKLLKIPLDLVIVRKLGHPFNPEYAIGAVAEDGHTILNNFEMTNIDKEQFGKKIEEEKNEVKRRRVKYLGDKNRIPATGKTAILVDDGVATGLSIFLAIKEIKHQNPQKIIVAIPVVPKDVSEKIEKEVDELVALSIPGIYLGAVGNYYADFPQVEDDEVIKILNESY